MGPIWPHMGPYGPYGPIWALMGPMWAHMGPIWAHKGPYGPLWAHMGPAHAVGRAGGRAVGCLAKQGMYVYRDVLFCSKSLLNKCSAFLLRQRPQVTCCRAQFLIEPFRYAIWIKCIFRDPVSMLLLIHLFHHYCMNCFSPALPPFDCMGMVLGSRFGPPYLPAYPPPG